MTRTNPWNRLLHAACALAMVAVGLAVLVVLPTPSADAAVVRPFSSVFSRQTNGSIQITGNTVMTCGTSTACVQAQNGTTAGSNNSFNMTFLDVDNVSTTTRSSSANLTIPTGARVIYAGLSWGAARAAGSGGSAATGTATQIKFRAPGATGYTTLDATTIDTQSPTTTNDYSAYRDVTSIVQGAGAGTYWGADIVAATGADRYAGWSLVVALEDPNAPLRDLNVFSGYATVTNNEVVNTTISGFLAPRSGAVGAKFGTVSYEGEDGITGDYFQVNTTRLADAQSPSANFFNSRVTSGGANLTNRNPASVNNLGIDAKVVDAPGVLPNGSTSANVRFATSGDYYYPAALTTQIDLYAPSIRGTKIVTNLAGNSPARVGDVLEYTLAFSNVGDDAAINAVATDPIPANTTFVPGSIRVTAGANQGSKTDATGDDQGEYLSGSRTVRVRLGAGANATTGGTLAPAASTTLTFQVRVNAAAAGTTLTNTGSLAYRADTIGMDYTDQTAEVATPVAAQADVAVTKTASPEPVTAGNQLTYTLAVTNNGPNAATGVSVVDPLPSGVTYVSSSPSSGTCSLSGQTLTCDLGTVPNGGTVTIPVVVRIPTDSALTSLTNLATVTTTTSDPVQSNNSASVTSTINRQADVALTKSVTPTNPAPGQNVTYTLVATNNGASRAAAVTVTDTLPTALTPQSASADRGTCTITGSQLSCAAGALDPGESVTVTVVATISSAAGTAALTNRASVASTTPDPNSANNTATATVTPAAPRADLVVTKRAVTSPIVAGQPVQYVVTVTNNGPSDASTVSLTDSVPASLSAVSATSTAGSCSVAAGTVTCALGTLAAGRSVEITVNAQLAAGATGTLANSATATSPTTDPNTGNNTGTSSEPITTSADLGITKTATPRPVLDGNVATYTIVVTNTGPSTARSVVVTDPVPGVLTFIDASSTRGSCTSAGSPVTVTCALGDLAVGATATVTVRASTPDDGSGQGATNTATVTLSTPDPELGNNSATHTLPTAAQADLALTKTVAPNPVIAGNTVSYTLTARNLGPSAAVGVTITDTIPAQVTNISATTTRPGASCAATVGNAVSCTAAGLPRNTNFIVTVTGTVSPGAALGPMTNDASVTSRTPGDPSLDNNDAQATTNVVASADVSVVKTGPASVVAGDTAQWTLVVANAGPSNATGVRVTDSLPTGVTFVSASSVPAGTTCTETGGTVTCPVGTLPPGGQVTIAVTGRIASSVPAGTRLTNTASAVATTPDPTPGNNSDDHTTGVTEASDVSITKSAEPATLVPGAEAVYLLDVTNTGPSDARDVVVSDTLDGDFTVLEATFDGGTCDITGQLVECSRDVLPVNADAQVRIRVLLSSDRSAAVPNRADVTGPSDTTQGNNSDSITSPVAPSADLELVKTVSSDSISAGEGVVYTLTVVNNGLSAATGVDVADTLPAGLVPATAVPNVGTCSVSGQAVSCSLGTLEPGTPVTIRVAATTSPGTPAGDYANNASVTSTTADPTPGNNSDSVSVEVGTRADVRVEKTATPATVVPGTEVTWRIVVTNEGPSTARDVVVSDNVPAGVSITQAFYGTSTPCGINGQQVTCNLGDGAPGQVVVTIVGTIASGYAGAALVNTATASTTTTDPTPGNNSSTVTSPVVRQADLEIIKTMTPVNPVAGQRVTYTISAYNNGPSDALNPQMIDQLPSGLTDVVIHRPTLEGQPATAECELRPPTNPGTADNPEAPTVFCSGPVFRAGLPARVIGSIEATIAPGFTGELTNLGRISSDTIDPVADNNESSVTTTVTAAADVSITKSITPTVPVPGEDVSWTVTVHNDGPSIARDVEVRDNVDDAITDLTASTGTTPNPCGIAAGNDVTCDLGDLAPGATVVITISGGLPAGFQGLLENLASVSSPTDNTPDNNTATTSSDPDPQAAVSITKAVSPSPVVPGQDVTWSVTVRNEGPSVARDVEVADDVDDAITDLTAGTGATPNPCTIGAGNEVACDLGDMPASGPGSTVLITLTGTVPSDFSGDLVNTATVDSPTDSTPDDNSATVTAPTQASADISLTKSVAPLQPVPGQDVTWTVVVTNAGPSVARDVVVTDDFPADVSDLDLPAGCTESGGTVTCDLGDMDPSDTVTLTFTGLLDPNFTGVLSNTATATSPTDNTPDNNTDTADGTAAPVADVGITKTVTPSAPVPGQPVSWTLVVTNTGPSVARDVTVTDDVDDAITGLTASPAGLCTISAGNQVDCDLGDLPVGARVEITLDGGLPADYLGDLVNTAVVDSPTDDSPDNNTDTSTPTTQPGADLSMVKSVSPAQPVAGQEVRYTLTVTNDGPSVARDVVITDDVLDALTAVTATTGDTPNPCSVGAGNQVTCDLGDVPVGGAGATVVVTITGQIPADFTGSLDNTATVTSPTDPNPDNNTDTVEVDAEAQADVSITKQVGDASPTPGRDISWTVVVTNAGPSTATDVTVTDDVNDAITGLVVTPSACTVGAGNAVDCDLGSLAPGTSVTITLSGGIPPDYTGSLDNTAVVDSPTDNTPDNNEATTESDVEPDADVALTKQVDDDRPAPGDSITWTVVVTNSGPSTATDVTVTDDVNDAIEGLIVSAYTDPVGGPSACTVGAANLVSCDLGAMAPGSIVTITLSGQIPSDYTGNLDNTAVVSSPTDTTPDNNEDTATAETSAVADLSISKSMAPAGLVAGEDVTFSLVVTNQGLSTARDVVVTDVLIDGLIRASAEMTDGGTCRVRGQQVTCTLDALATGATATVTIHATVDPSYTGTVTNTAEVTASTTDPDLSDNTDTVTEDPDAASCRSTGRVAVCPALTVTKTASTKTAEPGDRITYTITVTNHGPSTAPDVRVVDELDADLRLVRAQIVRGDGRLSTQPRRVVARFDAIAVDEVVKIRIVVRVVADAADGDVVNVAVATSDVPGDDDPQSDDTVVVQVVSDDDGPNNPDNPDNPDDGLPDTGMAAGVIPIAALGAICLLGGLGLVRRSRRVRHPRL